METECSGHTARKIFPPGGTLDQDTAAAAVTANRATEMTTMMMKSKFAFLSLWQARSDPLVRPSRNPALVSLFASKESSGFRLVSYLLLCGVHRDD